MIRMLLLVCAAMAMGSQCCVAEEVSQAALIAIGNKALAYKRVDEFSPSFDDSTLLGKAFDVTIPIGSNKIESGLALPPGGWAYDPDKRQLTVKVTRNGWLMAPPPPTDTSHYNPMGQGFEIAFTKSNAGKDLEQNAFGAKVLVQNWRTTSIGVASVSPDAIKQSVAFDPPDQYLSKIIDMPPDEARSAAKFLVVEIQGQVQPMPNGKAILCGLSGGAPKFGENPEGIVEHYCVMNSVITSISVRAGDRVLARWDQTYRPLSNVEYEKKRFDALIAARKEQRGTLSESPGLSTPTPLEVVSEPSRLGVHYLPLDQTSARMINLPQDHGLIVIAVNEGSIAEKAGFQKADVLLSLDGKSLASISDLQQQVDSLSPGTVGRFKVWRKGAETEVQAQF